MVVLGWSTNKTDWDWDSARVKTEVDKMATQGYKKKRKKRERGTRSEY